VLSQNGNRWVGAGHNAVVTDFSGQDWIVYHAVDQGDPYYAGTTDYTKRPALIDPLDWGQDGWPVVRGDRGPSDASQPGPAAQPGQQGAYTPSFAAPVQAGTPMPALSDEFSGTHLSGKWTWVRPPATDTYDVSGGSFAWKTQAGDIHPPDTNLASVLTEPAPSGDYVVEAKVSVNTPNSDAVQNYVQGGLIVYKDDGHYVRLTSNSIWNTRQTEFGIEVYPAAVGPNYGNGVVGPVGDWTYLRIVHTGTDHYTAYTSLDGQTWDKGDTWNQALGSKAKIGLISLGGVGFTTSVDYVRVSPVSSGG
jgi:arabinan endo-1,5-alpha-L-arabinosidase